MCNAHFQHLFEDTSSSSQSIYTSVDMQQQQQQQQQRNARNIAMAAHESDNSMPTLSPVSTSGWSYSMEGQSDVQMYSPASSASYSGFHSPIETNTRTYALAGALQQPQSQSQQQQPQQQQQHPHPGAAYPESSQRSTELTRGAHAPSPYFPEAPQVAQRWPYAAHGAVGVGHAPHDFAQEALSMPRPSSIMDTQAQAPSASDDNVPRDPHGRIPPSFGGAGPPRIAIASGPGVVGDQRGQVGSRQMHTGVAIHGRGYPQLQHSQHHRMMSSQSQQQQQQWLPHAHSQHMNNGPYLQAPTPRAVNMPQSGSLRTFFPYGAGGSSAELDYDIESDDFGEHEDFDDGFDDDDVSAGHLHLGIPPTGTGSPTPELQFPQGVSGTPSDLMRANFMMYGPDPANWPTDSLGSLAGVGGMGLGALMDADTGAGSSAGPAGSPSPRVGGVSKGKMATPFTPPEFFRPPEKREKGKRAQGSGSEEGEGQTVKVLIESATPGEPPKKVKMHQCRICQKLFPRPSGLATHMNSHSGARPFKCPLALCPKTFAVRSNARRHLRTHGITVPPNTLSKSGSGRNQEEPFHVGFETPVIIDVHDPSAGSVSGEGAGTGGSGARPPKLRWVPPSLASRSNAPRLRSLSPSSDMADLDAQDVSSERAGRSDLVSADALMFARRGPGPRIAPAPLPPAIPTMDEGAADIHARFEERNSYAETGTYPYHPDQWRSLPGPGLMVALQG